MYKESSQNALLGMCRARNEEQSTAVYMEILEDASTGVTLPCASAVAFGKTLKLLLVDTHPLQLVGQLRS